MLVLEEGWICVLLLEEGWMSVLVFRGMMDVYAGF